MLLAWESSRRAPAQEDIFVSRDYEMKMLNLKCYEKPKLYSSSSLDSPQPLTDRFVSSPPCVMHWRSVRLGCTSYVDVVDGWTGQRDREQNSKEDGKQEFSFTLLLRGERNWCERREMMCDKCLAWLNGETGSRVFRVIQLCMMYRHLKIFIWAFLLHCQYLGLVRTSPLYLLMGTHLEIVNVWSPSGCIHHFFTIYVLNELQYAWYC